MHVVMDRSIAEAAAAAADAASSSSLLPDEPSGSSGGGGGGGAGSAAPGGGFGGLGFGLENPGPAQWQGQEAAAWREQLHDKLLPVAVGLYRSGRLGAVLEQVRDNAAAEAKALVREVSAVLKERRPRAARSWAAWGPDSETVKAGHHNAPGHYGYVGVGFNLCSDAALITCCRGSALGGSQQQRALRARCRAPSYFLHACPHLSLHFCRPWSAWCSRCLRLRKAAAGQTQPAWLRACPCHSPRCMLARTCRWRSSCRWGGQGVGKCGSVV